MRCRPPKIKHPSPFFQILSCSIPLSAFEDSDALCKGFLVSCDVRGQRRPAHPGGYVARRLRNGLISPPNGLMETGEPGPIVPSPPGRRTMFKKIALCAMLVLILAPATVMAAGQQGQVQSIGKEAGSCLNVQHQTAMETTAHEKVQNGYGQGNGTGSLNSDARMLRNRTCDQDQTMAQNMTRDQVRPGSGSALAGEGRGSGSNGDALMLRNRTCDQECDQDQTMAQNMTRDQVRPGSGSGSSGENRGAGLKGDTGSENQQQGRAADQDQSRFGLTRGNGQNILTGFADQLGFRFRNIGGIFHTLLPQSETPPLTTP